MKPTLISIKGAGVLQSRTGNSRDKSDRGSHRLGFRDFVVLIKRLQDRRIFFREGAILLSMNSTHESLERQEWNAVRTGLPQRRILFHAGAKTVCGNPSLTKINCQFMLSAELPVIPGALGLSLSTPSSNSTEVSAESTTKTKSV
jgi:hypothetical protein